MSDEVSEAVESQEAVAEVAEEQPVAERPVVDVEAAVSQAVDAAMAALSARLDERLPKPEKVEDPEDPAALLEASQNRVKDLESALAERDYQAAVRDNAEAAGVRASAALDSGAVRAALHDIDFADSKSVVKALQGVAEKHDFLKVTTHARLPKASAEKPLPASGVDMKAYLAMSSQEKAKFAETYPTEFNKLITG